MNTNVAVISGRLVRDPETRTTQSGKTVAKFTLAVNRNGSKNGEKSEADFIPVVVWDKAGENCSRYLTKGSQAIVSGRISVRSYEAQDGSRRTMTEIVASRVEFVKGTKTQQDADYGSRRTREPGMDDDHHTYEITDDDVPF